MAGGNRSAAAKKAWDLGGTGSARSAAFKRLVAYAKENKAEGNWGNS